MSGSLLVRLQRLRALMTLDCGGSALQAYIIPSGDAHSSEYITACDQRRAFISGFTGSAGTAVVTMDAALLWTDGRYYVQAVTQMDSDWILMKEGVPSTLSQADWLCKTLPAESRVGVDPRLITGSAWTPLEKQLQTSNISLVALSKNLIDAIWDQQPAPPSEPLLTLDMKYTGLSWQTKVEKVRESLRAKGVGALIVTALDEIAWLLNLRGADISYNPVFFGYILLTMDSTTLFTNESRITDAVRQHLSASARGGGGEAESGGGVGGEGGGVAAVVVKPYSDIAASLSALCSSVSHKILASDSCSQVLLNLIPKAQRVNKDSPIALMKCVKNATEIKGFQAAHVRDSAALCIYLLWLENEVPKGYLTEISAAEELGRLRKLQSLFVSPSFATISSVGSNAAIIHYTASESTDRLLTTSEIYLCDSGGQYFDGTTDVTRTVHFGSPTEYEKECFTRVLKGHIALATAVFPTGVKGHRIDSLARTALWDVGLDYVHGTGHGVGTFLNVHEGPCSISHKMRPEEVALEAGMVLSNEPGYYEEGKFAIRIENLYLVVKTDTKFMVQKNPFLTFDPLTLVPIQKKLIDASLLNDKEVSWLDSYHQNCLETVGSALKAGGHLETYNWLQAQTQPLR